MTADPNNASACKENKLFFKILSSFDKDAKHLLSTALSVLRGLGPCCSLWAHFGNSDLSSNRIISQKNKQTQTLCILLCHHRLPTAVAASLNQSCLLMLLQGTRDPLFLTGVTFPSEYPIYEETKIKLTVYDVKDKSHDTVST